MPHFMGGSTTIAGHAWRRALEIAEVSYPSAYAELFDAMTRGASLDLWMSDDGNGYLASVRGYAGQFGDVLAALAKDRQDYEVADGQRLASLAARGLASEAFARSSTEGFGVGAFDQAMTEARLAQRKQAAKRKRGKRHP